VPFCDVERRGALQPTELPRTRRTQLGCDGREGTQAQVNRRILIGLVARGSDWR